ncbi:uncharacterized protein LOC122298853 [Carya illinoinensis]|uniref:uncharacterized protein LOC122298853 n=1 Tax=Carya illinoinensis TaxID=32201 RepID=UPI001C71A8C1|nr:uncharacterized protein LOC122298853 [Carya illinoinensis]
MEKVLLMAWGFWYSQNQKVFKHKYIQVAITSHNAPSLGSDYKVSKCVENKQKELELPPPIGSLKLNVDDAIFHDQQRAGIGAILRDEKGEVLFATRKKENDVSDPIEIELLVILRGVQLCIHRGINNLVIESDSLIMIQTIQDRGVSMSLIGNLVKDI